jgi:O-antigen/teichoic acid export membrane protein
MSAFREAPEHGPLPAWPIAALLGGLVVWWALGAMAFVASVASLCMIALMLRRGARWLPGLGAWAALCVWVLACGVTLTQTGSVLGYGMRALDVLNAGVAALYVASARERLTRERIVLILCCTWVTVVGLGFAALLAPESRLSTPLGWLLPDGLRSNALVRDFVNPRLAEVQQPWGATVAYDRPAAPFPYANSWGLAYALLTPVVLARLTLVRGALRKAAWGLSLLASLVPALATSNRGMLGAIGVSLAVAALRLALAGRWRMVLGISAGAALAAAVAVLSGAIDSILDRLLHSSSTGDRLELYQRTIDRSLERPWLGHASPQLDPVVGVAFGTQGMVWLLIFCFGFPALAFFLAFLAQVLVRGWRVPDTAGAWLYSSFPALVVLLPFYSLNTITMILVTVLAVTVIAGARPARPAARPFTSITFERVPVLPGTARRRVGTRAARSGSGGGAGSGARAPVGVGVGGAGPAVRVGAPAVSRSPWADAGTGAAAVPGRGRHGLGTDALAVVAPAALAAGLPGRSLAGASPRRAARTGGPDAGARLAGSTFALVIVGAVLAFGSTLLVGQVAGDGAAGVFFQIIAFFNIAVVGTVLGADTALVRELSARVATGAAADGPRVLRIALVPVAAVSSALALAAWIAAPALGDGGLATAIRCAAPFVPLGAVMTALFGALRGLGRIRVFSALQNVTLPVLRLALVAAVLVLGAGLLQLTLAWTVPVAIVLCLAAVCVARAVRSAAGRRADGVAPVEPLPAPSAKRFWSFASARGAAALVETCLEWVDVICVGLFLGPAAAGAYGAVNRYVRLGSMLDLTARLVTSPLVSASMARGDTGAARAVYAATTRVLVAAAWPFYLVLVIFAPVLLGVFGPGFAVAAPAMSLIGLAMMLAVSAGGVQSVLLMAGHSRWQLLNKLAALAVAVLGCVLLIPRWGLVGAATAWAASVLLDTSLATFQVWRRLGFVPPLGSIGIVALSALACFGGVGLAMRWGCGSTWWALLLTLLVGGGVYAALVFTRPAAFGLVVPVQALRRTLRRVLRRFRGAARREGAGNTGTGVGMAE